MGHWAELDAGSHVKRVIVIKEAELDTGNWGDRMQPEKVINYPNEITIRSNWDLELDWNLD